MNKNNSKRVGIKDIAAEAGVSIGTVDRVLHNRGEVSEATREKVLKIVDDFGYTPNIFAKSLSSKKTTKIAIVIPDSSDNNPYWEKPVKGIRMASEELVHYNTEIIYDYFDASNEQSFRKVLQDVSDKNPDGVVLNPVFKETVHEFIAGFDERNIPYVFIDIDLKKANKLAYFGQDAEQSGRVAAKLVDLKCPESPSVLILKQSKSKIFSQHIESRIEGFNNYFNSRGKKIYINMVEIDINNPDEPDKSLDDVFHNTNNFDAVFVPNSRGFKLGDYYDRKGIKTPLNIGYDLIDPNVAHLKKGNLTCLLSQKPEEQAYKAIWALFNNLVSKKEVDQTNYSAIDIIVNENLDYYIKNKQEF